MGPYYGFVANALRDIEALSTSLKKLDQLKWLLDPNNKETCSSATRMLFTVVPTLGGHGVSIDDAAFWSDVNSLIATHQARLLKERDEVLVKAANRFVSESAVCGQ